MNKEGRVAHTGDGEGVYNVLLTRPEGKRTLGRLRTDGNTILKWIFKK